MFRGALNNCCVSAGPPRNALHSKLVSSGADVFIWSVNNAFRLDIPLSGVGEIKFSPPVRVDGCGKRRVQICEAVKNLVRDRRTELVSREMSVES
ncbi:hypothetical protein TNCT_208731 [Trichonephila clavata]|uniref:Uncharacterized protein n=1 Tax=Trichonephila clavata TaxID=2740835 RepID=A0A8X6JEI4_TRICU|nr:hypothetical protein TNCT_208731 [Trichonephila clavata]